MAYQLVSNEEMQKRLAGYERRLENSKQFFELVTEMFRAKYNDRPRKVENGNPDKIGFAKMCEENLIGYINDVLDKIEKGTGQKQEKINYESNFYF